MTFVSYAQNFEDVLLWRALGHTKLGFYIDVGASHPDTDSVTRAFYDRGWRGINIEPVPESFRRMAAARVRDVNLDVAAGAAPGTATFYAVADANTGLSTLDDAAVAQYRAMHLDVQAIEVRVETLGAICAAHAPADIHFLKIDVEGAERDVLLGADFTRFRPWVVLAEATAPMSTRQTHEDWEPLLLEAGYAFAWFDGLNRFYVADERREQLLPHFRTPPNVFDNFVRAADTDWARRVYQAETRAETVAAHLAAAELRGSLALDRSETAHLRWAMARVELARAQAAVADVTATAAALRPALQRAEAEMRHAIAVAEEAQGRAAVAEQGRAEAAAWLDAIRRSTSWRVTAPLRRAAAWRPAPPVPAIPTPVAAIGPPSPPPAQAAPPPPPPLVSPPPAAPAARPVRAVHQFHSGTAVGDAITNAMLLTRSLLRALGYDSRIYAQHVDPALAGEIQGLDALPGHGRYVLIVRHSMGHDVLDHVLGLPIRKVLIYHNITPAALLATDPHMQHYAEIGRQQLAALRPAVDAVLADSAFSAFELLQAGYPEAVPCPILFDLDALEAGALAPQRSSVFTVLFVGRVTAAKGQRELVEAFAQFRSRFASQDGRESRLVLVGRHDGEAVAGLLGLIRRLGLDTGAVEVTGLVSDAERRRRYAQADLYVSFSQHEGFGVPLVEAVAHGVPVLAVATGAVSYTLGAASGGVLEDASPAGGAAAMLRLARDPAARAALLGRQRAHVQQFALRHQVPVLAAAVARAGAAPAADPSLRAALAAQLRFTVAGHVNGSYSLADINRQLALQLDAARAGCVRLMPVEGDVTDDISGLPSDQRAAIGDLLARPPPATGPHVLISQHYPVWASPEPVDLSLALFFWEESLVPPETVALLARRFRGVLAPSTAVAKAVIDSGLRIPVRVVGFAPRLDAFRAVRGARAGRTGPFTFLHVSSCFPRKGVDVLLAAYRRAFRHGDDVRLVIKGFPNPHNTVAADLARLQAADPGLAPVQLVDRDLDPAALAALYAEADAMVLPTRGEGYNLPVAEALAAGLAVIVTGHGGHMDFLPDTARTVPYRLAPSRSHLAVPFSLWAEPDEDALVVALRDAAADRHPNPPAVPDGPEVGTTGAEPRRLADGIADFAAELLTRPSPPPLTLGWVTTWGVRCGIAEYARQLIDAVPVPATIFPDTRAAAAPGVVPSWRLADPASYSGLMLALSQADPAAVVIQHQPGLLPWAHLPALLGHAALSGRVVCVTLHSTEQLVDAPEPERIAAVAALARMSRVVVHTVRDMNALVGLGLAQVATLVPQGIEPARAPAVVRPLGADDVVTIGCYGFFLPGKGIPALIEALALLRPAFPRARVRLVNAAYPLQQSADEIRAARDTVARLDLEDAVAFETGFLPRAQSLDLLADCDVVALPYQWSKESSSAALRGALAAGVPVAVTPLPLFDEAQGTVLTLPGTDPDSLAAGLTALLRDQAARQAAVAAGQAWSALRSWDAVGRRWHGLLDALLASGVTVGR